MTYIVDYEALYNLSHNELETFGVLLRRKNAKMSLLKWIRGKMDSNKIINISAYWRGILDYYERDKENPKLISPSDVYSNIFHYFPESKFLLSCLL